MEEHCRRSRQTITWSDLPEEPLKCIVKFIANNVDTLRHFRSVCRNWRQSAAYSIPPSLPIPSRPASEVLLIRPRDSTTTTPPWMVTVVEFTDNFSMFFHPFHGTPLVNIPPDFQAYHSLHSRCSLDAVGHAVDSPVVDTLSALFAPDKQFISWDKFRHQVMKQIDDDVVQFSYKYTYTLTCKGDLYRVHFNSGYVSRKYAFRALDQSDDHGISYRKRLVGHSRRTLYAIVRTKKQRLKVFQLNRYDVRKYVWDLTEVHKFGGENEDGLVLFVTRDVSFFFSATEFEGCQLTNCIVFSHDAFPPYSKLDLELPRDGGGIYMYQLGGTNNTFVPISSYPGFPCDLWSPPSWVLQSQPEKDQTDQVKHIQTCQDHDISLQKQKQLGCAALSRPIPGKQRTGHQKTLKKYIMHREPVKDKTDQEKQLVHSCQDGASSEEETKCGSSPSSGPIFEKQTIEETQRGCPADREKATGTTTIHSLKHVTEEGPHQDTLREGIIHSVSRAHISSILNQSNSSDSSAIKFEGLDIRSSLVPTLQKIWSKHGNIIENCLMRNVDIIAKALESLATVVLILEGNSAQSLGDHQADYLSSTLSDLKCMCFKVDWLVPCVEKAVELHERKPLIDSFNKLNQLNDKATERKSSLLDELAKVEEMQKKLKEDLANMSKKFPFLGEMDLNHPLGGGLT